MPIIGHAKNLSLLEKIGRSPKRAQSFIFSGPESVGKFTAARFWAERLIAGGAEHSKDSALDITVVAPKIEEKKGIVKEKEIFLEQIIEARRQLANYPALGKARVLIVDAAERMTIKAQNALLKTMEEPNSTSFIILVSSRPGKLIPTIHSRCQTLVFGLVGTDEIREEIEKRGSDKKLAAEIAAAAMGRPGLAIAMLSNQERIAWYRQSAVQLNELLCQKKGKMFALSGELSKNVPELIRHLEYWAWEIQRRGGPEEIVKAARISEGIGQLRDTQANARLVFENIFIR